MTNIELCRDRYRISSDSQLLDIHAVHAYLTRSYWAEGISPDIVSKAIEGSLCFGLFEDARQVGFARVITDRATFAYLCDVYVTARRPAGEHTTTQPPGMIERPR